MGTVGCHAASALVSALAAPCALRQGAGSTSVGTVPGTALCCPLLPTSGARPLPKPPCLCSGWAPASAARPSPPVEGSRPRRRAGLAPQRCWGLRVPPAAASLLLAVTVSVQRGNLGTESEPAAPHPLHWCYCGGVWPRSPRGRFQGRWRSLRAVRPAAGWDPAPAALPAPRSDRDQGPTLHASPASSASSPTCLVFKGVPCFISVQRSLYSLNPQVPLFVLLYNNGCGR